VIYKFSMKQLFNLILIYRNLGECENYVCLLSWALLETIVTTCSRQVVGLVFHFHLFPEGSSIIGLQIRQQLSNLLIIDLSYHSVSRDSYVLTSDP
jgi:hypothetical protein